MAGELYEVMREVLERLDGMEEYCGPGDDRNDYERVRTEVNTNHGVTGARVYVYRHPQPGADWKLYRLKQLGSLLNYA